MKVKLAGYKHVLYAKENGREKYMSVIPTHELSEEYKAKRVEKGLRIREFAFGSFQTPEEAEASALKYLKTGEVSYGTLGYTPGKFVFKVVDGKRVTLTADQKEEIEKVKAERKQKRAEQRRARERGQRVAAAALRAAQPPKSKPEVRRATPVVSEVPPVVKKLTAVQIEEIKDVVKEVLKYKKKCSLFTIRFLQVQLLKLELPDSVTVEVESEKWLHLKPKRK